MIVSSPGDVSATGRDESPSAGPPPVLKVVPRRHPWRWVGTGVVLVLAAQFGHGLATNPGWEWGTFAAFFASETMLSALLVTVELTVYATLIGFTLGVVLAVMRMSASPPLRVASWLFVWLFRAVPLLAQLLFWFNLGYLYRTLRFGLPFGPSFFAFETTDLISAMGAAVLGLGLHQAAYAAEIVRAGMLTVDPGQHEAAMALGMSRTRRLRRVVLPQAMRSILPNAVNQTVSLCKSTSVVSVMAVGDLFYRVQVVSGRTGRVVPMLMVATVWYVVLTAALSVVQYAMERHFAKSSPRKEI